MWLTGRLAPDLKTIAEFRRNKGTGIRNVCRRFVVICRDLKLFTQAAVAVDGSKFKAVNSHDNNFTPNKILQSGKNKSSKAFSAIWMLWRRPIARNQSSWKRKPND